MKDEFEGQYDHLIKISVLGAPRMGKSCLVLRFAEGIYSEGYISTIGVDFKTKNVVLNNNTRCKLQIFDIAGQESYRANPQPRIRGVNAYILCYDLTDSESVTHIKTQLAGICQYGQESAPILIVGTKSDLNKTVVDKEAIDQRNHGHHHAHRGHGHHHLGQSAALGHHGRGGGNRRTTGDAACAGLR